MLKLFKEAVEVIRNNEEVSSEDSNLWFAKANKLNMDGIGFGDICQCQVTESPCSYYWSVLSYVQDTKV